MFNPQVIEVSKSNRFTLRNALLTSTSKKAHNITIASSRCLLADEFFSYKESIPKQDIRSALKPLSLGVAMNLVKTSWLWKTRVRNSAESIAAHALVSDHDKPFEVGRDRCNSKLVELAVNEN